MNVGELLRERERLLGVIAEAKTARSKLAQINKLIAMYGDADNVSKNAVVPEASANGNGTGHKIPRGNKMVACGKCGEKFRGIQGVASHNRYAHGGKSTRSANGTILH